MEEIKDPRQEQLDRFLASGPVTPINPTFITAKYATQGSENPFYVNLAEQNAEIELRKQIRLGQAGVSFLGNQDEYVDYRDRQVDLDAFGRLGLEYAQKYDPKSTKGWGEVNSYARDALIRFENGESSNYFWNPSNLDDPSNIHHESDYLKAVGEGIGKWFTEQTADIKHQEIIDKLEEPDPTWTEDLRLKDTREFLENNRGVARVLDVGGINLYDYTRPSKNKFGHRFAINNAVIDALQNIRLNQYEQRNGFWSKLGDQLAYGIQDPLMLRDVAVTTALTLGLGTVEMGAARLGSALGTSTASGMRAMSVARGASNLLQLTGPVTGPIEGVMYKTLQTLGTNIGKSGVKTALARGLAIATEAGVNALVTNYADQRKQYEWKELLFDKGIDFETDWKQLAIAGATGFGMGGAMLGLMRFGIGMVGGEFKYIKSGDWKSYWKNVGNSLDTWARTDQGLTVFGETLSKGRGMLLGDVFDRYMKNNVDGRDFASVMVNGSRAYSNAVFTPQIAAKANFDAKAGGRVADAFAKATGLPGEIIQELKPTHPLRVLFDNLTDPDFQKYTGMSSDDIARVMEDYKSKKVDVAGTMPKSVSEVSFKDRKTAIDEFVRTTKLSREDVTKLLGDIETDRLTDAVNLSTIFRLEHVNKQLAKNSVQFNSIADKVKTLTGTELDFGRALDRDNFITVADFELNQKNGSKVLELMGYAMPGRGDFAMPDGTVIKGDIISSSLRTALGLNERTSRIFVTDSVDGRNPTFVITVEPDGTVTKQATVLKKDSTGRVSAVSDITKAADYKPENIKTVVDMEEAYVAIKKAVEDEYKAKKAAKDTADAEALKKAAEDSKEIAEAVSDIGKLPTKQVLMKHFGLTGKEATALSIVMDVQGLDLPNVVLRVARATGKEAEELKKAGAKAAISWEAIKGGVQALVRSTQQSDFGSAVHEMGHYTRALLIGNSEEHKAFRNNIGISDELWDKFSDWVGYKGDWEFNIDKMTPEQIKAEEKFTNAFTYYLRSIMIGDGKTNATGLHRLFSAMGDHLGDLGKKMESQAALEKGLVFTPVAKEVFEKLFLRSQANLTKFWEAAVTGIFRDLPIEERAKLGEFILGAEMFNTWKAKSEIDFEKAIKPVVKVAGPMAAVEKVKTKDIVESIKAKVSGAAHEPTKKALVEAIRAGITPEQLEARIAELRNFSALPESTARQKGADIYFGSHVKNLTDEQLKALPEGTKLDPIPGVIRWFYNPDIKNLDVAYPVMSVTKELVEKELRRRDQSRAALKRLGEAKAEKEKLKKEVKTSPETPSVITPAKEAEISAAEAKTAATIVEATAEVERTKLNEPEPVVNEPEAVIAEVIPDRFVDNEGKPVVDLTTEEQFVAESAARVAEDVTTVAAEIDQVSARVTNPEIPLEEIAVKVEEPVVTEPPKVNVEQTLPNVSETITRAIDTKARLEVATEKVGSTLSPEVRKIGDSISAVAVTTPAAIPELLRRVLDNPREPLAIFGIRESLERYVQLRSRYLIMDSALNKLSGMSEEQQKLIETIPAEALDLLEKNPEVNKAIGTVEEADIKRAAADLNLSEEQVKAYIDRARLMKENAIDVSNKRDTAIMAMYEKSVLEYLEVSKKLQENPEDKELQKTLKGLEVPVGKYNAAKERMARRLVGDELSTIKRKSAWDESIQDIMQEKNEVSARLAVSTNSTAKVAEQAGYPNIKDASILGLKINNIFEDPVAQKTVPFVRYVQLISVVNGKKFNLNSMRLLAGIVTAELVNNKGVNIVKEGGLFGFLAKYDDPKQFVKAFSDQSSFSILTENRVLYHGITALLVGAQNQLKAILGNIGETDSDIITRLLDINEKAKSSVAAGGYSSDITTPRRLAYMLLSNNEIATKLSRIVAAVEDGTGAGAGVDEVIAKLYRSTKGIDGFLREQLGLKDASLQQLYTEVLDWAKARNTNPRLTSAFKKAARRSSQQTLGIKSRTMGEGVSAIDDTPTLAGSIAEDKRIGTTFIENAQVLDVLQALFVDFLGDETSGRLKIKLKDFFAATLASLREEGGDLNKKLVASLKEATGIEATYDSFKTLSKDLNSKIKEFAGLLAEDEPVRAAIIKNRLGLDVKTKKSKTLKQAEINETDELLAQNRIDLDFIDGTIKNGSDLLWSIAESGSGFDKLALALLDSQRDFTRYKVFIGFMGKDMAAYYDSSIVSLVFSNVYKPRPSLAIHELIHCVTSDAIREAEYAAVRNGANLVGKGYVDFCKQTIKTFSDTEYNPVKELYEAYLELLSTYSSDEMSSWVKGINGNANVLFRNGIEYGFYNVHEMVSEALSNKAFAEKLDNIASTTQADRSILNRIYNAITSLFGLGKEEVTLLEKIALSVENISEGGASEIENENYFLRALYGISGIKPNTARNIRKGFREVIVPHLSAEEAKLRTRELRAELRGDPTGSSVEANRAFEEFFSEASSESIAPFKAREKARADLAAANGRLRTQLYQANVFLDTATNTEPFKKFFKDSVVTESSSVQKEKPTSLSVSSDTNKPLIMYHGTGMANFREFQTYDFSTSRPYLLFGNGVYLTESSRVAGSYAKLKPGTAIQVGGYSFTFDSKKWPNDVEEKFKEFYSYLDRNEKNAVDDWVSQREFDDDEMYFPDGLEKLLKTLNKDSTIVPEERLIPALKKVYPIKDVEAGPGVFPVYVSIKNPLDADNDSFTLRELHSIISKSSLSKLEKQQLKDAVTQIWADYKTDKNTSLPFSDGFSVDTGIQYRYNFFTPLRESELDHLILQAFKDYGYDGITHIGGGRVGGDEEYHRVFISWKQGQIKSVFNMGTWDAGKADLLYQADSLVDAADVRRRNLLQLGINEETTPEDLAAIGRILNGLKPIDVQEGNVIRNIKTSIQPSISTAIAKAFEGKNYRDFSDSERRDFITNALLPRIREVMGDRNVSAGLYSAASDSTFGKKLNSLIGGAVNYADTADSESILLQFISKIFDPMMDMRDGELKNKFNLFSIDRLNSETNNMMLRSGLVQTRDKILGKVRDQAELKRINDLAWDYLTRPGELGDTPNKDLILELINSVNNFNKITVDLLHEYGYLAKTDPGKYGTMHIANHFAYGNQKAFTDALTTWAVKKTIQNNEISVLTANALGWLDIKRDRTSDEIVSIIIKENSPIAKLVKEDQVGKKLDWNKKTKEIFADVTKLDKDAQAIHTRGLTSTQDYTDDWKTTYAARGTEYTALRQTMEIAKNRYLGIDFGDSKSAAPKRLAIGEGRNYSEERIISHDELAKEPELAKFFSKDIFDLSHRSLRSRVMDATMTKYISDFFGVRMSMSDLIAVLSTIGEETQGRAHMSAKELESRMRGYERVRDSWNAAIGNTMSSKDSVDKYYRVILENSRIPLTIASGLRAGLTSVPETVKALLTSNKNRAMITQLMPNLVKMIRLIGPGGKNRRLARQQMISATHWLRGLSTDHMLNRDSFHPDLPFQGVVFGQNAGGMFGNFVNTWRAAGEINKVETNWLQRKMNRLSAFSSALGAPLAFVNDVTTTLHIWNAQENFTKNYDAFLKMANMLKNDPSTNYSQFAQLAKKCGLLPKEALDLSVAGLLDPETIKAINSAAKNQALYTDGLLDARKMYIWAGEDQTKIDAINKMGAYINMTVRHTNTEPTLLDIRVNQSLYGRVLGQYMQFLLSMGVQEIGRRRRTPTSAYSQHLLGLLLMEATAYGTTRALGDLENDDRGGYDEFINNPTDYVVRSAVSMPLLGSYSFLAAVIRQLVMGTSEALGGPGTEDEFRMPDLITGPASTAPRRIGKIPGVVKGWYNQGYDMISEMAQE